jgi:hypothetical protein
LNPINEVQISERVPQKRNKNMTLIYILGFVRVLLAKEDGGGGGANDEEKYDLEDPYSTLCVCNIFILNQLFVIYLTTTPALQTARYLR